jgi:integrase
MAAGIDKRHQSACKSKGGGRCNCSPSYRAWVYSPRDDKKIRRTFKREAEARSWRADALKEVRTGALRAPEPTTLREAWEDWHAGAKAGTVRNRSGDPYKPSAIRAYEQAMRLRVLPELGAVKLASIRRPDLQRYAERLLNSGLSASTVQGTFLPLRAIFRRAISRGDLSVDPCQGLHMPAVRGRRERYASPMEAEALIAALPEADRPIWATAFYTGLRRGELMALTWKNVDLGANVIRVEDGWDHYEGRIPLKTRHARRRVPIPRALRPFLLKQRLAAEHQGFVFGTADEPVNFRELTKRADRTWKDAGLTRITPHEARHSYASLMIAAGVNAKALSSYMGHSKIAVTFDLYGHLMPGNEEEAAGLLDALLERERVPPRVASPVR